MMSMRYPNGSKSVTTVDLDNVPTEMDMMDEYLDADDGMDF
jgi:hypothetical protein